MVVTNDSDEPNASDLIGRDCGAGYRLVKLIGEGGMGQVYLAVNKHLNSLPAAVKVTLPTKTNSEAESRFRAEGIAAASIKDPHVARVFGAGSFSDGRHYLMMEYIPDGSLDRFCAERGQLPLELALKLAAHIASALDAAYQRGITHRDIKPENVMLEIGADGSIEVKITDWGIAKLTEALLVDHLAHKTATTKILGSPGFMSPEQCRGQTAQVDHRADVYALASILYLMVCGCRPYTSNDVWQLIGDVSTGAPFPRARSLRPDLPPACDAAIHAGLATRREDRTSTAKELVRQFARGLAGGDAILLHAAPRLADPSTTPSAATIDVGMGTALAEFTALHKATTTASSSRRGWLPSVAKALVGFLAGLVVMIVLNKRNAAMAPPDDRATDRAAVATIEAHDASVVMANATAVHIVGSIDAGESDALAVTDAYLARAPIDAGASDATTPVAVAPTPTPPARPRTPPPTPMHPAVPVAAGVSQDDGFLVVKAKPWADVFIDGKKIGTTPISRQTLAPGDHRVLLIMDDQNDTRTVKVRSGQLTILDKNW